MSPEELRPYQHLYRASRLMGADEALRRFIGWPADYPLPLSISHGVDFGHCFHPMDVDSVEPIHWATNERMLSAARVLKPSILAPHPWALLTREQQTPIGEGGLVIGPPPSPDNDGRLLELLRSAPRARTAILVKARGAYRGSIQFWQSHGFQTTTAESQDGAFYQRLHSVLGRYEQIISPTFSSAVVFAAALGKRVELLQGFTFTAYEPADYESEVNLQSRDAQAVVRRFTSAPHAEIVALARDLLGFELLSKAEQTRSDLLDAIRTLKRPIHARASRILPIGLRQHLARRLNKPGLLRYSTRQILHSLRRKNICIMQINDIDVWLSGKTEANFSLTPVAYQPGVTVPGAAPRGYPS